MNNANKQRHHRKVLKNGWNKNREYCCMLADRAEDCQHMHLQARYSHQCLYSDGSADSDYRKHCSTCNCRFMNN